MNILCIADIHGDQDGLVLARNFVVQRDITTSDVEDIDYIILMGDYSVGFKDPKQNLIDTKYALEFLKDDAKLLTMPGNCDQPEIVDIMKKHDMNFHEKVVELDGTSFIGLGGSNPTPFETPMELSEEEISEKLTKLFEQAKTEKIVLVTHFPPKDTKCDRVPSGAHVGSTSLRKIIEDKRPSACICSHIHESAGEEDFIGETKIVNVGMLSHGNGVVIKTNPFEVEHVKIK